MKAKLKIGQKFLIKNQEYIFTDIPVIGTFCYYAVNTHSGRSIKVRPDMLTFGIPLIVR